MTTDAHLRMALRHTSARRRWELIDDLLRRDGLADDEKGFLRRLQRRAKCGLAWRPAEQSMLRRIAARVRP